MESSLCEKESCFLEFDVVPIILAWVLCVVLMIITIVLWGVVCCKRTEKLKGALKSYTNSCPCDKCHCSWCNRLKCDDDIAPCSCKDCIDVESNAYKSCHKLPGCEYCSVKPPRAKDTTPGTSHEPDSLKAQPTGSANIEPACHDPTASLKDVTIAFSGGTVKRKNTCTVQCCVFGDDSYYTRSCYTHNCRRSDGQGNECCECGSEDCKLKCKHCCKHAFQMCKQICNCSGWCPWLKLVFRPWLKFVFAPWFFHSFVSLSNVATRIVYGTSYGVLLESKRIVTRDKFGRQTMYIDEFPVLNNSNSLHFMFSLKAFLWLGFTLSTGADIFFVKSELDCDVGRHCYIQDDNYDEFPIRSNCTEVLNHVGRVGICYMLVWDYQMALAAMGGMLSFTRIELAILAAINVKIVNSLKRRMKRTVVWGVVQFLICICLVVIAVGIFAAITSNRKVTLLRKVGSSFNFLGLVAMVVLSSLIPWISLVKSDYAMTKISKGNCMCLC